MTEDIGSDAAKRPQAVEIAILKERIREAARRDEALIKAQAEMVKSVNEILLMMRDGNARMGAIETLQEDTTNRLVILEADKKGPVAIIMATLTAIGAGAVAWFK